MNYLWNAIKVMAFIGILAVVACTGTNGQYRDDALIESKVASRILEDSKLRNANIRVRSEEGVVWLSGLVRNERLRMRAIRLAASVEGVDEVNAQKLVSARDIGR